MNSFHKYHFKQKSFPFFKFFEKKYSNFATSNGTESFLDSFSNIPRSQIKKNGLHVSRIGMGTFRIGDFKNHHEAV